MIAKAAAVAVAVGGITFIALVDPTTTRLLPPCPVETLTPWHCPGCGSARAIHAFLGGDLRASFAFNPLLFALVPAAGALALGEVRARRRGARYTVPRIVIAALVGGIALFGILRNVPGFEGLGP